MDLAIHVFYTVLMYFLIFVILRIMGKREIGKLSVFDLVISIMIAEIAVFAIEDTKKPLWEAIVPMVVLVMIQITIAYISLKSKRARFWFDGKPSIIIAQGHLDRNEMRRLRYNLDDLMLQLREQGVDNLNEVEYAIMESTGKLAVIMKDAPVIDSSQSHLSVEESASMKNIRGEEVSSHEHKTGEGWHKPVLSAPERIRFTELPLPLIMDGRVIDDHLEQIQKTRFWLKGQIQEKGIRDFKDVFLCTIDHKGYIYIDKKDALR